MDKIGIIVAAVTIGATVTALAATGPCRTAGLQGAALNVHATPGGRIVGTMTEGQGVLVLERERRRGQDWAYVAGAADRRPIGWVARGYVTCG